MRIISKFKDYYDNISAQYLDKDIVYMRKTRWHQFTRNEKRPLGHLYLFNYELTMASEKFDVLQEIIGFCGELYPVISFKTKDVRETMKACFYNFEQVAEFYLENKLDDDPRNLKYDYRRWTRNSSKSRLNEYHNFFARQEINQGVIDLFEKFQTPVFILRHKDKSDLEIEMNPMLRNYNFQKIKDPFSAHQELYQFISAKLHQPERPMVQISDKDKIYKHGFDKFSFRKLPTKKK